jgi:TolA-binding protein
LQLVLGANEWKESALLETARTQAFKIGDLDAGLAAFQKYLDRYPQSARRWEAEYQLAGVWFTKGDHARAKTQFAKFLAAHPDAPVADKAKEYLARCEAALRAAAEAAKRKPATPPPPPKPPRLTPSQKLLHQADAARDREKYADALADYQRLLFSHRNTPEYDLAVLGAARCHVELDNAKKAVELVEELLRTKPASTNAPAALLLLGELQLEETDQLPAAQATYERLLREHPNDVSVNPDTSS